MDNIVEIKNVYKSYSKKEVISNMNLNIPKGKIVGLLGPNGSGKSTLIKLINGLLQPNIGDVLIDGIKPSIETKRIVSYLPERTYLNDWMKVSDILNFFNDFYDDFDIIMVNKPPFMVVHPTKSHFDNTIANGITYYIKEKNEKVKVRFVNRLDMNTSGLVIVAKNAYAHHTLSVDMGNDAVEKKYITVVKGNIENDEGTINEPIYRPTEDSIKRIVDEKGQASITHYKVLERLNDATVVEVKLETGRTHQIRVHMSHIGHGIIGDELYGYVDESLINRQALHAYSLSFNQPRTKENLEFKAELPNDIKNLIEKLRKNN